MSAAGESAHKTASLWPATWRILLPLPIAILRGIAVCYLAIFKRFTLGQHGRIPPAGPVIVVANHTTAFDPVCLQVACDYRVIQFMQARELYDQRPWHFLYRWLKVIPVNRTGQDTACIKIAVRALLQGACLGLFPEGRISEDGRLQAGHPGAALLALLANATVVPAYFEGTRAYSGMVRDFLRFERVTLHIGQPVRLDDLAGRHRDPEARDIATQRIMDALGALRDRYETNPDRRRLSCVRGQNIA